CSTPMDCPLRASQSAVVPSPAPTAATRPSALTATRHASPPGVRNTIGSRLFHGSHNTPLSPPQLTTCAPSELIAMSHAPLLAWRGPGRAGDLGQVGAG